MSYLDAHIAHRLASGFRIFGSGTHGREVFGQCLSGSVSEQDIERLYGVLFPPNPAGGAREPTIGVRTSYRGLMDARVGGLADEGDHTPAHFPAVVVDLVDETAEHSLVTKKNLTKYTQIVEIMVIAKSKAEVRALHVLIQEMLNDSTEHFVALGYPGGIHCTASGDIRPVDAVMGGLMPNMLGMFQRFQRYTAKIVRSTPRIFSGAPIPITDLLVNHVDSIDRLGEGGKAQPK